ncbi:hypothetical protein THALO_460089 [Tenacibaculum halocynthiae]
MVVYLLWMQEAVGSSPTSQTKLNAGMVKLVNTLDLESSIERCESSSLSSRTNKE